MWNRVTVLLLVASLAVTTHSATLTREEWYPRFESWLVEHGKMYKVAGEEELRFQIYYGNVIYIEKHNSQNPLYTLKVNRFADLALDEYTGTYEGTTMVDPRREGMTESLKSDRYSFAPADVLPRSVDWREKGAVAAIKDQGTCGGSWAFSPIGSVEAFHYITTGELITLSEQQLLDCDTSCNKGCNGGDKDLAFAFIVENGGIDTDTDYPYTGRDERCYAFTKKRKAGWIDGDEGLLANHNMRKTVCIDGYEGVPANDEQSLQKAVANQPISVSIAAGSSDFQFYSGGIFDGKCGDRLDHAVLVVGYGTEAGRDYWLVRNSWGRDWGEQGYMRIERNVKEKTGKCGIVMEPLYPIKNGQNPPSPDAGSLHPNSVTSRPQQLCKEGSYACGNVVTILSLDGGGIRAIIPLVILDFLETLIQESLGENVKLADVFDVIAGTSTGGLVTAMLTVPNKDGHPMYTVKEILKLYIEEGPKIFPPGSNHPLAFPAKVIKALWGPKYDGEHLRKVIREKLQDKRLGETTTKAVITTFDIKTMQPVIFSSFQVEINPSTNVKLSDIVIATSAAPTYLPSHWFHYIDPEGNVREFNLIDGGVVANNPLLVAITEVIVEKTRQDPTWSATDYQFLVLSLGTGCPEFNEKYNAKKSSSWGILGWVCSGGSTPLLDIFSSGYSEMADYLASVLLEALNSKDLYLRIQETALGDDMASLDSATKENLNNLAATGEKLLKKPVAMKNAATGELEHDPYVTNEMAIRRLAVALREIYCARKKRTEMDKEV